MDSITHTVLGAVVGEAVAGRKIGKQAMLWGALANNAPDIDVITSFWMTQADSLLAHRGFTHSFLFGLLATPLLAYIFSRIVRYKQMLFKDWMMMFGIGIFIHIFVDALTCYGTGWYEPFSHHRVSINVLFVADPFYTLPLLISFLVLVFTSMKNNSRKFWTKFGIYFSSVYILFAFFTKYKVDAHLREELNRQQISYTNYFSTPTPLNNWLWYLVAKSDSGYYIGHYSVFDKSDQIEFRFRPQQASLINHLNDDADMKKLKRFSQDFYTAELINDTLYFNDIRFGTVGGWEKPDARFVFRYSLARNANNDVIIQRGRMESAGRDAINSLWERIKGQ